MLRSSAAIVLLVFAMSGCTPPGDDPGSSNGDSSADRNSSELGDVDLTFAYFGVADAGSIDQTLTITNPSSDLAVVPTLSFQALDENRNPLPDVTVKTIFGSDKGLVVAPANYEVFDILRFEGVGTERVNDIKVTVDAVQTSDDSGTIYPEVEYLDAEGRSVQYPYEAHAVRVRNAGASDYVVRLVGIRWNVPSQGRPQQARSVTAVGEPSSVGANSDIEIPLPARAVGRFDSLKAYISIH